MEKERKLTQAEIRRTERFEKKAEELEKEGYERTELTMGIVKANVLSVLVMLPFMLVIAIPYLRRNGLGEKPSLSTYLLFLGLFIFLTMAEVALHEGIHGLVWGLLNKDGFSAIEFGLIREYMTPYCYCGSPLLRRQYIAGSLMPTIVLGFIQGWIAVMTGSLLLLALSLVLMLGGGGDFLITLLLLFYRKKKKELVLMDHPTELGSVLFEKD